MDTLPVSLKDIAISLDRISRSLEHRELYDARILSAQQAAFDYMTQCRILGAKYYTV